MSVPPEPAPRSDVDMQPVSSSSQSASAALPIAGSVSLIPKRHHEDSSTPARAGDSSSESASSTPEYKAPVLRQRRRKDAPKAAIAEEEQDLLEEVLKVSPHKAEKNRIDKILRDCRSTENWVYNEKAATTTEAELAQAAQEAAKKIIVHDEEDEEDEKLRTEGTKILLPEATVLGEPVVVQRFFMRPARKVHRHSISKFSPNT